MGHLTYQKRQQQAGFTLLELAVVLIIVALLVGALLAGSRLRRAGEVRSVITEMESYTEMIGIFRDQMLAWPGDFNGADDRWGCGEHCDGDGDELIEWTGNADTNEGPYAWEHLHLAGMLEQDISGGVTNAVIGESAPSASMTGVGYFLDSAGLGRNYLGVGAADGNGRNDGPGLTPKQAYDIDLKLDDGISNTGYIQQNGTSSACASSGNYVVSSNAKACSLRFELPQ